LQAVLNELKTEQKKVINIANKVFTRSGEPIKNPRTAWENARKRAGVKDVVIHDFRRTAKTNWAADGLPDEVSMAVAGHSSQSMHDRYVNLQEHHLVRAFKILTSFRQEKEVDSAQGAS